MENLPTLPNDVIRQILSCCSCVDTLLRLTRSCKFFRDLIKCDHHFAYSHSHRTLTARQADKTHRLTYSPIALCEPPKHRCKIQSETSVLEKTSIRKNPNPIYIGQGIRVAGSSNGIICLYQFDCKNGNRARIYLWNPTLRQARVLPGYLEDCAKSDFIGFGYDTENQQHKFVHIHSSSSKVDMYCLETNSWKSFTHDLPCLTCLQKRHPAITKSVELKGSLHWISTNNSIIRFGLSDERVSEVTIPMFVTGRNLGVVNGCLSLFKFPSEVWSMHGDLISNDEYDCDSWLSWKKTFEIDDLPWILYEIIELATNGKVIAGSRGDVVSFDPETYTIEKLGSYVRFSSSKNEAGHRYQVIGYVLSLIPVNPPKC